MRTFCFVVTLITPVIMEAQTSSGYKIGDKVADFRLKNVDGSMVSLYEQKEAKGAIVIFTCNHCPYAKAYEQRIIELDKTYRPKGFPVLAINPNDPKRVPDDSFENMVKRAKEKKYTFPYLFDETQQVARTFGATRTPQVFLLRKSGEDWVVSYIGAIDDNTEDAGAVKNPYVINALEALLKGQEPPVRETKAVGCTIKWKV
ncbi:MAG: thioredoxin family protein [Chitinophagales bacterium]|nr:thioredoxin family protein [Chitinophagales bacterium]MDW8428393.1 thioredoxin family protein [Chitinophagales bacterium]